MEKAVEAISQVGGAAGGKPFVVVAGYGVPGRVLVELLVRHGVEYRVIELSPKNCERGGAGGIRMVTGNAADPKILVEAGVERATLVALMMPGDEVVLEAVTQVRKLNPTAFIIARCAFTSAGMEALRRGADRTIVAERLIAQEVSQLSSWQLRF